jgi:hypothetical protein
MNFETAISAAGRVVYRVIYRIGEVCGGGESGAKGSYQYVSNQQRPSLRAAAWLDAHDQQAHAASPIEAYDPNRNAQPGTRSIF